MIDEVELDGFSVRRNMIDEAELDDPEIRPGRVYRYRYTVAGPAPFPVDMLCQDEAWPADPEDASALAAGGWAWTGIRGVTLVSHRLPTRERWESFGWRVK